MKQHQENIDLRTKGRGLHTLSRQVQEIVRRSGVNVGACTVFVRHTSASLLIQENADPSAETDLEQFLQRFAPDGDPLYTHVAEGPDDMSAHVRSAFTRTSETIPVNGGRLLLGPWQGIFLYEHRLHAHDWTIVVHVVGA